MVLTPFRHYISDRGWVCYKTHGNQFQAGFPDLYCVHSNYSPKWLEFKRPEGDLTHAQRIVFGEWNLRNVGIWIICAKDLRDNRVELERQYQIMFAKPNVGMWLSGANKLWKGITPI